MEGGKGVGKNEGKDEISTSSHLNEGDVHHEDKKNDNSSGDNVKKNGASSVICCICVCPLLILLIVILPVTWIFNVKKNGTSRVIRCMFVCLVGILIASLTEPKLKDTLIWGLELWKWTIFVLVILCGQLISNWLITIPHALFTRVMNVPVVSLDLAYEMKKSVRPLIWLGLILLVWVLLINPGVERSKDTTKILDHVTNALVGCLVVAAIWFAKSFLIRLLAYSFQHGRFLDRIEKIPFKIYVIGTLLNDPPEENSEKPDGFLRALENDLKSKHFRQAWDYVLRNKTQKQVDQKEELSSLIKEVRAKLSVRIREERMYKKIRTWISRILELTINAATIPSRVANLPGSEYICKKDLQDHLDETYVDDLLDFFPEARKTEKIEKSSLEKWMVDSLKEFEELADSLDHTKETLGKLDRPASGIAIVTGIIVWCFMMGILTTRVLVLISSQILAASFMFGDTVKTVFEAIILVFIMHPFDVGDQCVIDEEQMLVQEIRIMCTIFSRNDMQEIFYPNSVLLTKPIRKAPKKDDSVDYLV